MVTSLPLRAMHYARQCIIKKVICALLIALPASSVGASSTCYGTTANGRLEGGVQLPFSGPNYVGYSWAARLAGRTYVHSTVRDVVVSAYEDVEKEQPSKVYKYAETGLETGGQFKPHKTHRNGLSVDFMTPVVNGAGESVNLPTNLLNKLGYAIEFNASGEYDGLRIDYQALAAHIVALDKAAKERSVSGE
jgi:penicillin-insensitive murein endopeptidase